MESDEKPARRRDIDRLRVLACISTFCYHPLTVFDLGAVSHIKSGTTSAAFDIASRLLHTVRMPLFFLIAGIVGFLSLRRWTNRHIIAQRAKRLLLPFLFGVVLIAPVIKYFEILDGRNISWQGAVAMTGPPPEPLVFLRRFFTQARWFSWSHLWFLAYLFVLGCALLPVMRRLDRARWPASIPVALGPLAILGLLIAVELVLRPVFPLHIPNLIWDWANVAVYLICLVSGAALVRFPSLEALLQRWWPAIAVLACLSLNVHAAVASGWVGGVSRALSLWSVLCLLIGLGPWLSGLRIFGEHYLAEAVLPLYVLHLLPLVVIAYYVKDLDWPIWLRYIVMVAGGFTVTLVIYHYLVRPFRVARLALGLSPRT
ncbi:MAG: acyltransferase family protein [Hyphomicrobiaceae bacterium]